MNNKNTFSLLPLLIIVIGNYVVQVPYDIHLYHGRFNPIGTVLLLITLVWFLLSYYLTQRKTKIGYWLLLPFLLVQIIFYFHNEIILSFFGYGMFYHFTHTKDWILWTAFLVGDINFFAACYYAYILVKKKIFFK